MAPPLNMLVGFFTTQFNYMYVRKLLQMSFLNKLIGDNMHWQNKWKGAGLAKCLSLMDRVREGSEPRTALIERHFQEKV